MITIRKADITDIPSIQQVAQITWPPTFGKILSSEQIIYMLEMMYSSTALSHQMNTGQTFLLALEENHVLGYASYEFDYKGESKTKIHKIYVLPDTQGKGVGRQLIEEVGLLAKEQGQIALSLNVNRFNRALTFYEHLGFVTVGEEDIAIGQGYLMEDYILEKPFPTSSDRMSS